MHQTIKNRLINFSGLQCSSEQQKNCHRQAFNSLMIKISQLDKYEQVQQFTHCQNPECMMVLTNQDRDYIDDWNWVTSNQEHYKDIQAKIQKMKTNKWNYYIWNCRFCATKNLISKDKTYFAKNKSKVVIKDAVKVDKNSMKGSDSPLLLFLIDNSSSMEEDIPELNDQNKIKQNKQLNNIINQVLKKTHIYQKIIDNEKKNLSQIKKKIEPQAKQTYSEVLTKHKILMSMVQRIITQICQAKNKHQNQSLKITNQKPVQRKIGFVFFNSDVIMQKIPKKNQTTVIKVSDKEFENDRSKQGHLKVDFNNFNQLYQIGKSNSQNYGMQISQFKFSDIQLHNVSPSGQTALGPALAIASGIVSGYGSGSLIVIVTDGKANKGIFSQEGIFQEELKLLKIRIDKAKSEVCLMKLDAKNNGKQQQSQSTLQSYFKKYASIINVSLFQKQVLKQLHKKLLSILQKSITSKTWTQQLKIKCQNPNIKYDKDIKKMKNKLFKEQQTQFIVPQVQQTKFSSFDYRHPFMTQILVYYQNIQTKQQSKFMAYIMQKLIKFSQMNKKDQQSLNSIQTLQNVLNYLDLQGQKLDMNNIPLSLCQLSFRTSIMQSYKHSEKRQKKQIMLSILQDMNDKGNGQKNVKDKINDLIQKRYEKQDQQDYLRL